MPTGIQARHFVGPFVGKVLSDFAERHKNG
jgi:hypothetical protein